MKPAKAVCLSLFAGYPRITPIVPVMTGTSWFCWKNQSNQSEVGSGRDNMFRQWWLNIRYALPKSKSGNRDPSSSLIVQMHVGVIVVSVSDLVQRESICSDY